MRFDIMTLFPDLVERVLGESIIGRAQKSGACTVRVFNIRDYSEDRRHRVDDTPFGGGKGMLLAAPPIYNCYRAVLADQLASGFDGRRHVVYLSPAGRVLNQSVAAELADRYDNLILLCGHYEGVDHRIIEELVDEEISLGDFVLTGGELAAITIIDAVSRLVPGVLGKEESFEDESFSEGLLEYPQYTRPPVFMGREVPEVLLSGHHGNVAKWRREQALIRTAKKRPDLLKKAVLTKQDIAFLQKQGITIEETE